MTTSGTANAQRSWELAARAGYAVSGVLHILIGVLGLRLAFGSGGEQADQSGALSTIASTPFGALVLWFSVAAFLALGAWQVAKAIHGELRVERHGGAREGGRVVRRSTSRWRSPPSTSPAAVAPTRRRRRRTRRRS